MDTTRGPQDGRIDVVCGHRLAGCQKSPLIRIGAQFSVDDALQAEHEQNRKLIAKLEKRIG